MVSGPGVGGANLLLTQLFRSWVISEAAQAGNRENGALRTSTCSRSSSPLRKAALALRSRRGKAYCRGSTYTTGTSLLAIASRWAIQARLPGKERKMHFRRVGGPLVFVSMRLRPRMRPESREWGRRAFFFGVVEGIWYGRWWLWGMNDCAVMIESYMEVSTCCYIREAASDVCHRAIWTMSLGRQD